MFTCDSYVTIQFKHKFHGNSDHVFQPLLNKSTWHHLSPNFSHNLYLFKSTIPNANKTSSKLLSHNNHIKIRWKTAKICLNPKQKHFNFVTTTTNVSEHYANKRHYHHIVKLYQDFQRKYLHATQHTNFRAGISKQPIFLDAVTYYINNSEYIKTWTLIEIKVTPFASMLHTYFMSLVRTSISDFSIANM